MLMDNDNLTDDVLAEAERLRGQALGLLHRFNLENDQFPEIVASIIQMLEDLFIDYNEDGDLACPPMDPEDIEALQTTMMKQEMLDKSSLCPVCLDTLQLMEEVTVLRCDHFYHASCIRTWLGLHASCPVCRRMQGDEVEGDAVDGGELEGEEDGDVDGGDEGGEEEFYFTS